MPSTSIPTTPAKEILYTIKIKKSEIYTIGRGQSSTTGELAPRSILNLPTVATIMNRTYVITNLSQQELVPREVNETTEEFIVTGTLHSRTQQPLSPAAEFERFKHNNVHQRLGENHYEFGVGSFDFAPFKMFSHANRGATTLQTTVKKHLSALTSEHMGKTLIWHYNAAKNCAWMTSATKDELNKLKTFLASADIPTTLSRTKADKALILIIEDVPIDKLEQLATQTYNRLSFNS
jgi:hypothetical protein